MTNFPIIFLDSTTERVKLPVPRDKRTKEQKQKAKEVINNQIESNITPFISNISKLKQKSKLVYLYLSFDDLICSEDVQKCIKKITGDTIPKIKTVSEDETSVILEINPSKISLKHYKRKDKYLSYFKALKSEPKVFSHDNFAKAYKEISSIELVDNLNENHIIIILNTLNEVINKSNRLLNTNLFEELHPVSEIGILFGILKDPTHIKDIRQIDFVACAYLENFEDLAEEYPKTKGKTEIDLSIKFNKNDLITKPTVCIIDCGISNKFLVLEEKRLNGLGNNLLDHGTQIASIAVAAKSLLKESKEVIQEFNLLSYKISDGKKENIIEGLVNAIKLFSNKCNLFVLSYNFYYQLPPILLHYLSKRIDSFIQKSNAIVLVSTGNNCEETIKDAIDFNYLDKNPILFPSNCKNVISTGALLKYDSYDNEIANYTRYLPYFPDLEHSNEEFFILKPNIYVFGGGKKIKTDEKFFFPSVAADNKLVKYYGTSYANGLLAYYFLKLINDFNNINYAETYKAILLASGNLKFLDKREEGSIQLSINSIKEFESDIKHVLLMDEHETDICIYRRDQTSQNSEELSFFIDAKKVSKIQVFLVHSNNYIKNPYTKALIYFNIRLYEPNASKTLSGKYSNFGDKSKWSTFGKCTPTQVAEYDLGKKDHKIQSQTGEWKLQIMPMRKNIPTDKEVIIRWGLVIKLIPRRDYIDKIDEIYDDIMEKTKGIMKEDRHIEVVDQTSVEVSKTEEVVI